LTTHRRDLRLICLMALVMQLLLPIGSSGGIRNIGYVSLWLSLPLFALLCQRWSEGSSLIDRIPRLRIKSHSSFNGRMFLLVFFCAFGI
ncbi:MAG: hypothetical protein AAGH46_10075, partial [Bacteroidota bacterium]